MTDIMYDWNKRAPRKALDEINHHIHKQISATRKRKLTRKGKRLPPRDWKSPPKKIKTAKKKLIRR